MLLPDELPMRDPHHLKMDMISSDESSINFTFEIAQCVRDICNCSPLPKALPMPRFFVCITNDLARNLLNDPFGKKTLWHFRVKKSMMDFNVTGHRKFVDL